MIGSLAVWSKTLRSTRLLLLRHAETSAPERFHGAESDVGLGEQGRVQAERVARALVRERPDAVYCSAMRRARETAEPVARACGLQIQVVESLHERRMGPLSGQLRDDAGSSYDATWRKWEAGELDATHEGGESYAQIHQRVVPALRTLLERHAGQTVVVIAHGVVIRVLLCSLVAGYGSAHFSRVGIEFVAVNDLIWNGASLAFRQPDGATVSP